MAKLARFAQVASVSIAASASGLFASSAFAQSTGFSVSHFNPSERGSEWFALDSLDMRGHLRPAVGVVGDYAYRPLVETDADGNVVHSIVRNQLVLHPGASLVLWERLRVAIDVPIDIYTDGHAANFGGITYAPPADTTSLGDIRLGLDLRLFGAYGDPITGALGVQVHLPTGSPSSYSGDGSARVGPRFLVAGDVGPFVYGAMVGATVRSLDTTFAGAPVGSDVFFGASAGLRLADRRLVIGPEIFGHSVVIDDAFFTKLATPVEWLLGGHYTVGDGVRLGAGIGTGLTGGYGTPQERALVSIEWTPVMAPPDRDRDGILDGSDACPDVPGVATNNASTNGCPPAPPPAPAPLIAPPTDRDGDGVPDAEDACPDVAGVRTNDPKTNGCPLDRDGDGVLDKDDACPDVAGLKTNDPKTNGCPDPDRDHDGVPNALDACPDEAGKPDADPKKNGCPKAYVLEGQIKILDQVKFKTGSAVIAGKDSEEILQAVSDTITHHPEIKKIRVEGHTDNRGGAAMNQKLSAGRAASVVTWLAGHGIEAGRLTSEGFGLDRPIDTNDTDAGRQNNRRVEFHIEP